MSGKVPLGDTIQTGSEDEIWDSNCRLIQSFGASHPDLFLCRYLYTTKGPVVENRPVADFRYPSSHLILESIHEWASQSRRWKSAPEAKTSTMPSRYSVCLALCHHSPSLNRGCRLNIAAALRIPAPSICTSSFRHYHVGRVETSENG